MHALINQLAFSLFKKNSLQDCSVEELKSFAEQYPYYTCSHLLYSAKLKETGNIEYINELQKTSLYFNNPLWLDFILSKKVAEQKINTTEIPVPAVIPFEDFNNDELVVENPRPEIFTEMPVVKERKPVAEVKHGSEETEPAMLFDPYYTVDYFASQGIKTIQDDKPKDRFGQQLKSFTEWLKAIKNIPQHEKAIQVEKKEEEEVVLLADHSIEERNVITEAMAEVWIKQGHPEKAMDIYSKLSLLNPSKSSYFATLIDSLKK